MHEPDVAAAVKVCLDMLEQGRADFLMKGGVSHFNLFRDNALISWMHTRLVAIGMARWFLGLFGWRRGKRP